MNDIKGLIDQLQEKINALSLRARVILFLAISVVLYIAANNLLLTPLDLKQQQQLKEIQSLRSEITQLETQAIGITSRDDIDPNQAERQQLAKLQEQIKKANNQIGSAVGGLIPPDEMALALENLLQRQGGIKFISIENMPAEPLLESKAAGAKGDSLAAAGEDILTKAYRFSLKLPPESLFDPKAAGAKRDSLTAAMSAPLQGIYRHSLKIQFEGSYLETLSYLRKLEALNWSFRWDQIEITMQEYPVAHVTLMIHTISLDERLIGV